MHWFIENVDEIQHVKISTQNGFFNRCNEKWLYRAFFIFFNETRESSGVGMQ